MFFGRLLLKSSDVSSPLLMIDDRIKVLADENFRLKEVLLPSRQIADEDGAVKDTPSKAHDVLCKYEVMPLNISAGSDAKFNTTGSSEHCLEVFCRLILVIIQWLDRL